MCIQDLCLFSLNKGNKDSDIHVYRTNKLTIFAITFLIIISHLCIGFNLLSLFRSFISINHKTYLSIGLGARMLLEKCISLLIGRYVLSQEGKGTFVQHYESFDLIQSGGNTRPYDAITPILISLRFNHPIQYSIQGLICVDTCFSVSPCE